MLTVRFYNYWGKSDVINKKAATYSVLTATRTGIAPDMPFDFLNNVQITLNEYINTNYMWITADGDPHEWYYTVNVTQTSDQQYVYQGFIDAAATAFYNGCMDNAVCRKIYSPNSTFLPDPRIAYAPELDRQVKIFNSGQDSINIWYSLNVAGRLSPSNNAVITSGGNIISYLIDAANLNVFFLSLIRLPLAQRQKFWNSVISVTPLRMMESLPTDGLTQVDSIALVAVCDPVDLSDDGEVAITSIALTGHAWRVDNNMPSTTIECLTAADTPIEIKEPIDMKTPITISIQEGIKISFTPAQLETRTFTTISVRLIYDTLGNRYIATPIINGILIFELTTSVINTEVSSILRPQFTNQLLTASSYVGSIVGGGTSVVVGAKTGNPALVVGGATSLIGTAAQLISDVSGATVTGTPIISGYSGSIFAVPPLSSYIQWSTHKRITSADFNIIYGYPCDEYTTVHAIGYSQVAEVYLDANGLPDAVIQAAIQTLKSGYRITD